jgi:hypothetical protein
MKSNQMEEIRSTNEHEITRTADSFVWLRANSVDRPLNPNNGD